MLINEDEVASFGTIDKNKVLYATQSEPDNLKITSCEFFFFTIHGACLFWNDK